LSGSTKRDRQKSKKGSTLFYGSYIANRQEVWDQDGTRLMIPIDHITDLFYVGAFFAGGLALAFIPILISHLIAPIKTRNYVNKTGQAIECGIDPIGDAWIRFGVVYYLYALIFIGFSVDVLYLLPVAIVYNEQSGYRDLAEVFIFIGILLMVLLYAWRKGVFIWKKKIPTHQP
jgi:NADH:ubiquinone oxidoreductase subunit 3 (subunit A)